MKTLIIKESVLYDDLADIIFSYYRDEDRAIFDLKFQNKQHNWLLNQIIGIIDDLKKNGLKTNDFLNSDNWGLKNGNLAYFDIGYGDYFEPFQNDPDEIKLTEDYEIRFSRFIPTLEKYYKISGLKYLAKGGYGAAFVHRNKVYKVTNDRTEAVNAQKLLGKTSTHLADYYDVRVIKTQKSNYYVLVMELLDTSKQDYLKKLYNKMNMFYKYGDKKILGKDLIKKFKDKNTDVGNFLEDLVEYGSAYAWEKIQKLPNFADLDERYDLNDVADISEWIYGSKTNDGNDSYDVPDHIHHDIKTFLNF